MTEKPAEKHDYIYANNKLLCEIATKGSTKKTYYHHTDHLGTTVCITDSTGKVVCECTESAFGDIIKNTNNNFTSNFTGKFLDEDTGLYYFNARWYDLEIGRFVTEDPARDGRNWFVYCRNNPLFNIDPDGMEILSVVTDKQEQSTGNLGNSETTTIASAGCTLDTFYRMAKTLGYQGSLDDANDYAINNNLFLTDEDGEQTLLSQEAGAKLVNGLLDNPFIKVSYDSSKSVNKNDSSAATKLAKSLNAKESEKKKYFATLRQHTGNKYFTKEYDHSMSINHNAVSANDVSNIDNPLGFNYNDTASTNRTGTNDTTRLNQPFRIDYFKVEYLNWAQIENGY